MSGASSYALFVDRPPVAPGRRPPAGAADVVLAASTSAQVRRLLGDAAAEEREHHLVVVALGPDGRRLGERAGIVDVRIDPTAVEG